MKIQITFPAPLFGINYWLNEDLCDDEEISELL